MNTATVAQLLTKIDACEGELAKLRAQAETLQEQVRTKQGEVEAAKRLLAEELKDMLPEPGRSRPVKTRAKATGSRVGRNQSGAQDAVLRALADGGDHPLADCAAAMTAAGLDPAFIANTLAYMTKRGKIARASRGVYRLAARAS